MKTNTRREALRMGIGALALPMMASRAMAASHAGRTVEISGFAFNPAELRIGAGESVTFVNMDGAPHTATGDGGAFDTGRLGRGEDATVAFPAAGTFTYFCRFHPGMRATIVVA